MSWTALSRASHVSTHESLVSSPALPLERARSSPGRSSETRCSEAGAEPDTPSDWPGPGPIDLEIHDLPHASSNLEWWYLNCHVTIATGRELSLFAAFFRQLGGGDPATGQAAYTHSVAWALCDPAARRYHPKVAVDASAPAVGLQRLDAAGGLEDGRLERALREVLGRGRVPGPTRMFGARPLVGEHRLALDYGGDRLRKTGHGYELELHDEQSRLGCALRFLPRKPATRHGSDGRVHGVGDERMFYYFIPRCAVSGIVTLDGEHAEVRSGSGWYDHEFGVAPKRALPGAQRARNETTWRWLSLQLDDGTDVSVFVIARRSTGEVLDDWTVISHSDGTRSVHRDARLEVRRTWRSTRSFIEYPVGFRLELAAARLVLDVDAAFADQEVLTVISDPGFWEGRVSVKGSVGQRAVSGRGWVECKGFRFDDLGDFFGAVGAEVRERLGQRLPEQPSAAELGGLAVRGEGQRGEGEPVRYVDGVAPQVLARSLVRPIREIADRGGKGWRSYAALACIDVVGGDSRRFLHWLPIAEILHVGSLIVDDVEDASSVRRGGPTCHLLYGTARAINAGTAAYFLAEPPLFDDELSAETKLRIYRLYFDALRAGHAGQALDLEGVGELAEAALASGRFEALEEHVLAVHRLKTAVPAGMLARIGALLGGGTDAQVAALGQFFESVGLAFQIIDDVLNLRGFERGLKQRGEDIENGKLTLPVVRGLRCMLPERRRSFWSCLRSQPRDRALVNEMIAELEDLGALDHCQALARARVEEAWARLDPVLPDSQFKVMFRAFSWYVLERHY